MDDYVSRQLAIDSIMAAGKIGKLTCCDILRRLPSVHPELTHMNVGKSKSGVTMWYKCEYCEEPCNPEDNFCSNCGRKFER